MYANKTIEIEIEIETYVVRIIALGRPLGRALSETPRPLLFKAKAPPPSNNPPEALYKK